LEGRARAAGLIADWFALAWFVPAPLQHNHIHHASDRAAAAAFVLRSACQFEVIAVLMLRGLLVREQRQLALWVSWIGRLRRQVEPSASDDH
jgi:hypothetical protein